MRKDAKKLADFGDLIDQRTDDIKDRFENRINLPQACQANVNWLASS
jgi:hypothetical protein